MLLLAVTAGAGISAAALQQQRPDFPSNVFIGGLGYAGSRIASAIHDAHPNVRISGTVRSSQRRDAVRTSPPAWLTGDVHVLDVDDEYVGLDAAGLCDLRGANVVVQTVAPICDYDRDPLLALHSAELTASAALEYVAYVSSTGVYGDRGGEWVTEESELLCTDAKSLARVRAEGEWGALERQGSPTPGRGTRVDCFRCGGIYGPGRGPLFSSLASLTDALSNERSGGASPDGVGSGGVKYVNRILVDDISNAILAGIHGDRPYFPGGRAYNLVDDDPAPRRAVTEEARRLLAARGADESSADNVDAARSPSVVAPPRISTKATRNTRRRKSRGTGNKRCSNARLKGEYGWIPSAPTFREGLAFLLELEKI